MNRTIFFVMALWVSGLCTISTQAGSFDFKDPKGVNTISFSLDSPLEPLMGFAAGVSGILNFDPANPKELSGSLHVPAANLAVPNKRMQKILHSEDWIDVEKYPTISFSVREVLESEDIGSHTFSLKVRGAFRCKDVEREITVPMRLTYLPDRASDRGARDHGDLLALRTMFTIQRTDYTIKPSSGFDKVANDIRIQVAVIGYSQSL